MEVLSRAKCYGRTRSVLQISEQLTASKFMVRVQPRSIKYQQSIVKLQRSQNYDCCWEKVFNHFLYIKKHPSQMKIICYHLWLILTAAKIILPHNSLPGSHIIVETTSAELKTQDYDITYRRMVAVGKNKRDSYYDFLKKYRQIIRILIAEKILPNPQSMIHSPIQRSFLKRKRKWEFSRVFVIYSHKDETNRILAVLERFRLLELRSTPLIGYLNEKFVAILAFSQAKMQVEEYLRLAVQSELSIQKVEDIELLGNKVQNEDGIEEDLEFQYNFSEIQKVTNHLPERSRKHAKYYRNILNRPMTIKVVFRIGTNIVDEKDKQKLSDTIGSQLKISEQPSQQL